MNFQRPPIYPFWLWNGNQTKEELTRQLYLIEQRGLSGATIHARTGNQIPYLSEQWMELFRHVCREAQKLGLHLWIYDEYGFPSGSANGALPALGEAYQQKYITFSTCPKDKIPLHPLAVFPRKDGQFLVFQRKIQPNFPDFLYPKTASTFLKLTHEKYFSALKEYFGNVIQAFFTDDNVLLLQRGAALAYSDDLEETFSKEYGFSLLKNLDALAENRPGYEEVRLAYYRHLAFRLNHNFIQPMRQWCLAHGVKLYGHLSFDEGPLDYCARGFGDTGQYMMTLQVPGCDDFHTMHHDHSYMRNARNHFYSIDNHNGVSGFSTIEVIKQASSVASQLGDGNCMVEAFSSLGWGVSPASLIAHMNFLCQMGMTISVPHYYAYSTALQAKRDHPASFFFQQPYFSHSKKIFAETDRSLQLTARGRNAADVLLIHPIVAAQASIDGETMDIPGNFQCEYPRTLPSTADLANYFQDISLNLMRSHIAFEYGYESIIEKYGVVHHGALCIGKATYHTIILPKIAILSQPTRKILLEAAANGVRIILLGANPAIPGEFYNSWDDFAKFLPSPLLEHIAEPETAVSARLVDGHLEYMLVHYGTYPIQQHFNLPGYSLYDPVQNCSYQLPIDFWLSPCHAVHLIPSSLIPQAKSILPSLPQTASIIDTSWEITRLNPNYFLINAMRMPYGFLTSFDSEDFLHEPKDSLLFQKLDYPIKNTDKIFLCYEPLAVSMLKVNGKNILSEPAEPCEPTTSLVKTDITPALQKSARELILTMQVRKMPPEFLYLQGNFGVRLEGKLTQPDGSGSEMPPEPCIIPEDNYAFGNLAEQGLPFYWGKIKYATTITSTTNGQLKIVLPEVAAAAIELQINELPVGIKCTPPWEWEIPISTGKIRIKFLLMNTAQNFFGPHHPRAQKKHFTAWRPYGDSYFSLASFGILQKPILSFSPQSLKIN